MQDIRIDPRMFIHPPYITCPHCGKERFGVLWIGASGYARRCSECLLPGPNEPSACYSLPKLHKKIVYLDQFALSNMMKALNPKVRAHTRAKANDFWVTAFEKLHSLCQAQLIICPDSYSHYKESVVSPFYQELKRLYELLSGGVTFYDPATIERFQVCEHARNWLQGRAEQEPALSVASVTHGEINAWQERIIITWESGIDQQWIDDLRKTRASGHQQLEHLFRTWQAERDKTFDDWYEVECNAFGDIVLQLHQAYLCRMAGHLAGLTSLSTELLFPPPVAVLIASLGHTFRSLGLQEADIPTTIVEYLRSPSLRHVPAIKISAMLYAAMARKAASGQKRPPTRSMLEDIRMLSVLLPYCDAMFVDKECHAYLREEPLRNRIDYGTEVFSLSDKGGFLAWLDKAKASASPTHMRKVEEVYGKDWCRPFISLYRDGSA